MARIAKKYYLSDDPERAYTPSQVKKLGKDKQLDIMETWFRHNYCDPAEETPYESKEGGYQYIWGGPYDADEELQDEFSQIVPLDRIQGLAEDLAAENWQWAPSPSHPSRADEGRDEEYEPPPFEPDLDQIVRELEAGASPRFGDEYEIKARRDVVTRLEALETVVQQILSRPAGIGHNGPPDDEAGEPTLSEQQRADIAAAASEIKEELSKPAPDAVKVGRAAIVLREIGKWLASKLDRAVDKVIDYGVPAGIIYASTHSSQLLNVLGEAVSTAANWLHTVTLPF